MIHQPEFNRRPSRSLCRPTQDRRGVATVEFAVMAPVLILLVLGMFEYGRLVMTQQTLANAAREGARRAIADGASASDVQTAVEDYLSEANLWLVLRRLLR